MSHHGTSVHNAFTPSEKDRNYAEFSSYSTPSPTTSEVLSGGFQPTIITSSTQTGYSNHTIFHAPTLKPTTLSLTTKLKDEGTFQSSSNILKSEFSSFSTTTLPRTTSKDFTSQQKHYTTISPAIFHSTISHPKLTTKRPRFTSYPNTLNDPTTEKINEIPVIVATSDQIDDLKDIIEQIDQNS